MQGNPGRDTTRCKMAGTIHTSHDPWTPQDDIALNPAARHVALGPKRNKRKLVEWNANAAFAHHSSTQQFSTSFKTGTWSPVEDQRLRQAVAIHGPRWVSVALEVGTRNGEQCAKRWNEHLNPNLDHSPWTAEEDELLICQVDAHGKNWKTIANSCFEARAPLALKNRYSLLMRRRNRTSIDVSAGVSATSSSTVSPAARQHMFDLPSDYRDLFVNSPPPLRSAKDEDSKPSSIGSQSPLKQVQLMATTGDHDVVQGPLPTSSFLDELQFGLQDLQDWGPEYNPDTTVGTDLISVGDMVIDSSLFNSMTSATGLEMDDQTCWLQQPSMAQSDKITEFSITCQREKLRSMVLHMMDVAIPNNTMNGPGKEDVALTLRFKNL